jgi:hypothetical protein
MGLNSTRGIFFGDVIIKFKDGNSLICGKVPAGIYSGYVLGK